ncbi:hypothetical protein PSQ20_05015 [Curvibacter sp. RS43]|uniref:hypothetical protein n=1 Tax=Curvibacter microcysteis TaxID=3026419 RepID=UPI00236082CB|nr:hypothetical protein [Curvibacter sp. RS43]MDD0809685.1 hypothetical protein [Curvibacter sp. RS43]
MMFFRLLLLVPALLLAGCDIPGLGPDPKTVQREADSKATGSACRYAQRGIEDCYTLNPKALKAAVFEGWKEMDAYMRENKIEGAPSVIPVPVVPPPPSDAKPKEEVVEEAKPKKGKGSDKH